jgi:hypothetical protein
VAGGAGAAGGVCGAGGVTEVATVVVVTGAVCLEESSEAGVLAGVLSVSPGFGVEVEVEDLVVTVVDGVSDLPEVVEDGVAGGAAAAFAVPAALAELGFDGAPPEAAFGGGAMAEITELGSW